MAHPTRSIRRVWEEEIPCSRARQPTSSGQRQLSNGWRSSIPVASMPLSSGTLQRRLQDWRALNGPDQEVYFPQEHPPGRESQFDFTHGNSLGVTVAGQPYPHLLFQLILSHSGWRYAEIAAGETFLALKQGVQNALCGPWAASPRWCAPTIPPLPPTR